MQAVGYHNHGMVFEVPNWSYGVLGVSQSPIAVLYKSRGCYRVWVISSVLICTIHIPYLNL